MATKKTEAKIEISAEVSQFQKSINNINKDITTLNNQLKLNATQLKGDANNVDLLKERQTLLTTELQKASQKVADTSSKLEAQKKAFGEDSTAVQNTTNQLLKAQNQEQAIKNELNKVNQQIEITTNSFKENSEEVKDNRNAYEKLQDTISNQESDLKQLRSQYASVVLEQGKTSDEAKELKTKIDSLNSELRENKTTLNDVENELDDVNDASKDAGNGGFTVFKGALADLASNAVQNCLSGLKDLSSEIHDIGVDFDYSISKVKAISGATDSEIKQIEASAKNLGATTKFTSSQVADGFQYMALAGWKTNDMVTAMPAILNLATAGDMDLAKASDIVTDYLTAFGLTAKDSSRFVDQMAFAMSNSNTDVEQLGEAYKNCASTSTQLGYSLEDTTSALMVMANSGIKGGEAGTALSSIMTRLGNNVSGCRDMLKEYGVEVYDSNGKVKSLSSILSGMKDVWANLSDEQKSNLSYTIAGKTAQSQLMTVLSDSDGAFEKYTKSLKDCGGTAQEMSDIMSDNLKGSEIEQGSLLEALGNSIFDDFESPLKSVTDFINKDVLKPLISLNEKSGLVSAGLIGISVALGVLAIALGISTTILAVNKAMSLLNGTMITSPITLVVALIAGLVVALIYLWNNCDTFRNFIKSSWQGLKSIVSSAQKLLGGLFKDVGDKLTSFKKSATEKFNSVGNSISSFGENAKNKFNNIFGFLKENKQGILLSIASPFLGGFKLLYDNCDGFRNFIDDFVNKIKNFFSPLTNFFSNIFSNIFSNVQIIINNLNILFQFCINKIKEFFSPITSFFQNLFTAAYNAVVLAFSNISNWFREKYNEIIESFSNISNWFGDKFNLAYIKIQSVFSQIGNWFSEKYNSVTNAFSNIATFFSEKAKSAYEALKKPFNQVGSFFTGIFNTIKSKFSSIGSVVGNAVSSSFKSVINAILSRAQSILNSPINAINSLITKIRKVPGLGGLARLNTFSFPRLKKGLNYVPKDYYGPVYLDEGERVLTKEQNALFNANGGLDSIIANRVNSQNSMISNNINLAKLDKTNELLEIIAKKDLSLYVDSNELAQATANASDQISGEMIELRERGLEL